AAGQAQSDVPPEGRGPYTRNPEAIEAIERLKSPYCPGLMLEVCPSSGGMALRDSLADLADAGLSSDELVEWVIANHGEEYRALPGKRGVALLAWIIPPLGAILGVGLAFVALGRMRKRRGLEDGEPFGEDLSDEQEERLREALRELEEEEEAPFL
ncbi:MAG TPA: cytochrome c-type biogenesis protein CcmH, partial [Longimicrobiales bacterium]